MQFQESPVNAPITNVHNSNQGNNNANNTIVGDNNTIFNFPGRDLGSLLSRSRDPVGAVPRPRGLSPWPKISRDHPAYGGLRPAISSRA
jgi:hypothetical protein